MRDAKTAPTMVVEHPADQLRSVRRFVLRFSLVAGALLTAYYFPYDDRSLLAALRRLYLAAYAHLAAAPLSLVDSSVRVEGTRILGRVPLEFALSCDAMDVLILFAAATFAFPASWRRRGLALALASISMVMLNVTRILVLYLIGLYAPSRFDLFHMLIFPLALVVLTAAGFVAWTRLAAEPQGPAREKGAQDGAVRA